MNDLSDAIEAFRSGEPVLIYDSAEREDEIDLVYPAHRVTPAAVAHLRNDAGGLICVALSHDVAEAFDLPFLADVVEHPAGERVAIDYDDRSSFSLPVNHRETYTGITDVDRARTIRELGEAARDPANVDFAEEFDTPGHVPLLKAAPDLLRERQGHTEYGIALADLAEIPPAVVVSEMLDDQSGCALSRRVAASYASENGYVFLDGATIAESVSDCR